MSYKHLSYKPTTLIPLIVFISAVFLLLASPKTTFGATVLSNYPLANHDKYTELNPNRTKAVIFEVPAGNNYTLNSFTVALSANASSTFQADLYTASGTDRGAFVGTLGTVNVDTGNVFAYSDITFTPSSAITLLAGQRYWLQLSVPMSGGIARWSGSDPDSVPSGTFTYITYRFTIDSGASWSNSTTFNSFILDADEVIPTATPTDTATNTPITPTNTPTDTPVPATGTATSTPTDTQTSTPLPPTSTPTNTPVTPTPTLPICIFGLPPGGVQGRVLIDVLAFYNPSLEATTNILVQGGSSWWIIDARNGFYKLWISCEGEPIWVLANTVAPNFDNVWNGASLPDAGE